jgi:transposase
MVRRSGPQHDIALPDDLAEAHALIRGLAATIADLSTTIAEKKSALAHRDVELARLTTILKKLQRRQFGAKSERLDPEQMSLGLEDIEIAIGEAEATEESRDATIKAARTSARRRARSRLPDHLLRIEQVVDVEDKTCACCGGALHQIGEDVSERLDVIPSQFRALVTRRPKYACRTCTDGVVQAPAPPRLIEGGLPTEALVAHLVVGKYADHLPLYRQHQILQRAGIEIDRSCLAEWVGRAAFALRPVTERLLAHLKRSAKLFCDETPAPVLDPGRGRTKKGYLWAIARDDRPWSGGDPPGVVYVYAPGRGGEHARRALEGFSGILQVDGYGAYAALADTRTAEARLDLAFCWAHWRRDFFDLAKPGNAPIAAEALARIGRLYAIEDEIRGRTADERRSERAERTAPLVRDLFVWLETVLEKLPQKGPLAEIIRYGLKRRTGLMRFLDDGRIEIDNNTVERAMRPIALSRKNALFAGSDEGGAAWGVLASLIETCKLNSVEPHAYITDVLEKIVAGWPANRIDDLLPWAYVA